MRSDAQPLDAIYPVGTTTIAWTATDASGNRASGTQSIVVADAEAPTIAGAALSHTELKVPNHMMVDLDVMYTATDNCDGTNVTRILSVTSNEPQSGTGDGDTAPDWEIVDAQRVRLRAERSGNGTGRVYTITITTTDSKGNASAKSLTCAVPRNR